MCVDAYFIVHTFVLQVPIAIAGRGLANVAATVMKLPGDYEPTLIEVVRD